MKILKILVMMLVILTFLQTIDLFSAHFSITNGRTKSPLVQVVVPTGINPKIGNDALTTGDEIAVFDSQGNCWGYAVWKNVNTAITVYGIDPAIDSIGKPLIPGMPVNEDFKFRIWDNETNTEYSSVSVSPVLQYSSITTYGLLTSLNALSAPVITKPINNSTNNSAVGNITWNSAPFATSYDYVLSINSDYSSPILNGNTTSLSIPYTGLASLTKYYLKVRAKYSDGNSPYTEVQFTTAYSITLTKGWNIISSNYLPDNPNSMEAIFNAISDKVVIVKNNAGKAYMPQYEANEIGNWDVTQGYLVYVSEQTTLSIIGTSVDPSQTQINLTKGWNMISYLRNSELDCVTAFASLTDNNNLVIVKNNAGKAYMPQYEANEIGNLIPGQGYLIYVSNPDVLVYPGN